jgi:DNA invertase Pin-like site-specific DNA recombinase
MTETNPQKRRLGYAHVSTYGQTLDAQLEQLRADGCAKVYREKASGAQAGRRELLRMLKDITPGDVVTVTRIDRLARSTFDLFATVKRIVDAGGQFRSLAEPWADTVTSTGRLMIAVLGRWQTWSAILSAPARRRAGAAPRRADSIWAAPLLSPRSSRRKPASAARMARR